MSFRTIVKTIVCLTVLLAGYGKVVAQMVSFGFDGGVLSAEKTEILLNVTPFQITSGSVLIGSVSSSQLPNPPYAQSTSWTATERSAAKHFFFEMSVPEGFQIEIDRVSFLAEVTSSGPSAVGLSIGDFMLPEEDISDAQILSVDYDLTSEEIAARTLRFEIRAWRNGSRETSGSGTFRVDDIMVYGRVSSTSDGLQVPYMMRPSLWELNVASATISSVIGFDGGAEVSSAGVLLVQADFDGDFLLGEPGVTVVSAADVAQSYTLQLTGLVENTRYKVRSFAVNTEGTGYSDILSFSTRKGFDGSGYYHSFRGGTVQDAITPEWSVSDTTLVGAFGTGSTGGLRWSNGVLGYQLTSTLNSFQSALVLQNTTGEVLDEVIVAYHGRSAVTNGLRFPDWTVTVNNEQIPELAYSTVDSVGRFGIQYHLTNLAIEPDSVLEIRWQTNTVPTGSGTHRPIGLSDVIVAPPSSLEISLTGDAGWRMLAPPVWFMHAELAAELSPLQGFDGDGAARNLYNGYNGSEWLPSAANEAMKRPERLRSGTGYILYLFDNSQLGSSPIGDGKTLRIDGIAPFFDIEVPLHADGNRWNLLGNPFSQGFDIRELTGDGEFVPIVQIWQDGEGLANAGEQSDGTWVLSNSSSVNNIIAAGQGFMLQNASSNAASRVTFPASGRVQGGTLLRQQQNIEPRIEFQLSSVDADKRRVIDLASQIVFIDTPEEELHRYQVDKLPSLAGGPQLSVLNSIRSDSADIQIQLAQLALPMNYGPFAETWLDVTGAQHGRNYLLSWGMILDVPHFWDLILTDAVNGAEVNLRFEPEYSFTHVDGLEPDNSTKGRFHLKIINSHATGIDNPDSPLTTSLHTNFPNPFNPTTALRFDLAEASNVTLEVFDLLGRRIATPVDGFLQSGRHTVTIDAGNWASGIYLYRLSTADARFTRKMTLIR